MTHICVVILSSNFPSSLSMIVIVRISMIPLKQLDFLFYSVSCSRCFFLIANNCLAGNAQPGTEIFNLPAVTSSSK